MKKLASFLIILILLVVVIYLILIGLTNHSEISNLSSSDVKNKNMKISSSVFAPNQNIPAKYTCDGQNTNPPLEISGTPEDAKSLTLIVDDHDAPSGTWVHWIVINIDPKTNSVNENSAPTGSTETLTSFGRPGYGGPCPPSGIHHYHFKIYALDSKFNLNSDATPTQVENEIKNHLIESAELIGLYQRK